MLDAIRGPRYYYYHDETGSLHVVREPRGILPTNVARCNTCHLSEGGHIVLGRFAANIQRESLKVHGSEFVAYPISESEAIELLTP